MGDLGLNAVSPETQPAQNKRRREDEEMDGAETTSARGSNFAKANATSSTSSSPAPIPLTNPYASSSAFAPAPGQPQRFSSRSASVGSSSASSPQTSRDIIDEGFVAERLPTSYDWHGVGAEVPMAQEHASVTTMQIQHEDRSGWSTMGPPVSMMNDSGAAAPTMPYAGNSVPSSSGPYVPQQTSGWGVYEGMGSIIFGSPTSTPAAAPTVPMPSGNPQTWSSIDPTTMPSDLQQIHLQMQMALAASNYTASSSTGDADGSKSSNLPSTSTVMAEDDRYYFDAILNGLNGPASTLDAPSATSSLPSNPGPSSVPASSSVPSDKNQGHHVFGNFGTMGGSGADEEFVDILQNAPTKTVWDEWNTYISGMSAEMPVMGMGGGTGVHSGGIGLGNIPLGGQGHGVDAGAGMGYGGYTSGGPSSTFGGAHYWGTPGEAGRPGSSHGHSGYASDAGMSRTRSQHADRRASQE